MAPSEFPLISLSLSFKGGAYLWTGRTPGYALIADADRWHRSSSEIDDLDFLATQVSTGVGRSSAPRA